MAKRKTELDKLLEDVTGKFAKKANAILMGMEDEQEFLVSYMKLLEYAKPKLQRSEVIQENPGLEITIEHVASKDATEFDVKKIKKEQLS